MTEKYEDVMAERVRGKPRPYSKGHRNYLLPDPPPAYLEPIRRMTAWSQRFLACAGALIVFYGMYGMLVDDLYIPGWRSAGRHYHGADAHLMFAVLVSFVSLFMTIGCNGYDAVRKKVMLGRGTKPLLSLSITSMLIAIFRSTSG